MIKIECKFIDNRPIAIVDEPYADIGIYLQFDIQNSLYACNQMLKVCSDARNCEAFDWSGSGNAFNVFVNKRGVMIQADGFDETTRLGLTDFEKAIKTWKDFLTMNGRM